MRCLFVVFFYVLIILSEIEADCAGNSFQCNTGECIALTSVCDGAVDCRDRSDETQATCSKITISCPTYGFRCAYGACIDKASTCNGIKDCADNSDELLPECRADKGAISNSLCSKNEFQCDSGQCIGNDLVCDGKEHCKDGSDETITQCISMKCPTYSFQCAYGGCIDPFRKCDGKTDCIDGSDEDSELCKVHVIPVKEKPRPNNTYVFNPINKPSNGCRLPPRPEGGDFDIRSCFDGDYSSKCRKVPGTVVRPDSILDFKCHQGFELPEHRQTSICTAGSWKPEPPQCLRLCKGLNPHYSVDVHCTFADRKVGCTKSVVPGTKLEVDCKLSYKPANPDSYFTTAECLPDGTWSNDLYRCNPECGVRNADVTLTIANGYKAKYSEYPWHAGLYEINENQHIYFCGGTIVNPKAILTAAHCVYDESILKPKDKNQIAVAVGKYTSVWDDPVDKATAQKFGVASVIIQDKYFGKHNRYEQDIAILSLINIIIFGSTAMPVCFDRSKSFILSSRPNDVGTVVGWGITENNTISHDLLVAHFPTFNFYECRKKIGVKDSFALYITYDKFCAGRDNGTYVEKGDSGGALTIPWITNNIEHHYMYGVVSLKSPGSNKLAVFTNVTVHLEWITKVLYAIQQTIK